MDDTLLTTFAVVYSVIFCTNLSITERRAAFQQKNFLSNVFSVAITAILPTVFCFSALHHLPLIYDKLEVVYAVLIMAWYCSVPFGASHFWLVIVCDFKLAYYVTVQEAKGGPAHMVSPEEIEKYISVTREWFAAIAFFFFPVIVEAYLWFQYEIK